jgi:hypothetical protein
VLPGDFLRWVRVEPEELGSLLPRFGEPGRRKAVDSPAGQVRSLLPRCSLVYFLLVELCERLS